MSNLLGTLHFSTVVGVDGRPGSKYEGVVVGLIIRRDDGSEVVVKEERPARGAKPIPQQDLKTLTMGTQVQSIITQAKFTVVQVYPDAGDVWVRDDNGKDTVLKYTQLRRTV